MIARVLVGASALVAVAGQADAERRPARALASLRSPAVTVRVGAVLPVVRLYERPGPWAGVALGWALNPHAQVVASADLGVLLADGARRYLGSLDVGVRVAPSRPGPLWVQLGLGTTGYVERIGVVLPDRRVSATDTGALVTADLSVGVRVRRWEVAVGYDHVLRTSPYYARYDGDEELPFWGSAMAWVGRSL